MEDVSAADWDRCIDVNVRGTANTVQAAYPLLVEARGGALVLMASLSGLLGTPLLTPYAMTKHAVVGLGEVCGRRRRVMGLVSPWCVRVRSTRRCSTSPARPGA